MFGQDLDAEIMDEKWINLHVKSCVTRHIASGNGIEGIISVVSTLSKREIKPEDFVREIGVFILESTDPSICLARGCVQEAIVYCIVNNGRQEPQVPALYLALASAAIAKHILSAYKRL
jgi:hypothetical protein